MFEGVGMVLFIIFFILWVVIVFSMNWIVWNLGAFVIRVIGGGIVFAMIMMGLALYLWWLTAIILGIIGALIALSASGGLRLIVLIATAIIIILIAVAGIQGQQKIKEDQEKQAQTGMIYNEEVAYNTYGNAV